MRLVCPHCAAAYELPPTLLGRRRRLRCARCGRDWVAQGEPTDMEEAAEAVSNGGETVGEPRPAAAPRAFPAAAWRPVLHSATALRLGWAASLLALAIGTWQVVAWRGSVMRAWPPSQRLYAALGLTRPGGLNSPNTRPLPHAKERAGALERGGG